MSGHQSGGNQVATRSGSLFSRVLLAFHAHDWDPTATNGFGHPCEERCSRCGEYRHLIHDARNIGREPWLHGRHPKSEERAG